MKVIDLIDIQSSSRLIMAVDYAVASERHGGESLVKFITRSKYAARHLRHTLYQWKKQNKVNFIISGERYHLNNMETQYMLNLYPEEGEDSDIGAGNPLITVTYIYT